MSKDLFVQKVRELKSSSDKTQRDTYTLLALMLKETYHSCSSSSTNACMSKAMEIKSSEVTTLKKGVNSLFGYQILTDTNYNRICTFNPEVFLELREAFRSAGEELPPLEYNQLLESTVKDKRSIHEWANYVQTYRWPQDLVGSIIYALTPDRWNERSSDWDFFEDVVPEDIIIFIYETKPDGIFIEAIASKKNIELEAILAKLRRGAENEVNLQIKKNLLEPNDKLIKRIKAVLNDNSNSQNGFVSRISYALKEGTYQSKNEFINGAFLDDPVLPIIKAEGWLQNKEEWDTRDNYYRIKPFVEIAYQSLSAEDRLRYESDGLSILGTIIEYHDGSHEHTEMAIKLPYLLSKSTSFPFSKGDKLQIEVNENSLVLRKVSP